MLGSYVVNSKLEVAALVSRGQLTANYVTSILAADVGGAPEKSPNRLYLCCKFKTGSG